MQITLKQETADVWGDAIGKPIERPPFTQLPSGGVAQPQNLKYTVEEIGQVVQGVLSWQNIGQFVYNKVVIRKAGQTVLSVQVPGSFTRLTGLVQSTYTAHVTAVNQMGAESPEAYLEFSIQAPPAPSRVDIEQSYFAITLYPRLAAVTNVSTQFDFWTSGETKLPNTSTSTVEGRATRAGIGTTWSSHNLKNGHTYYWYVRTINAFGTSAFVEVAALCQTDTSGLIDVIDESVRNSDAMKNVEKGIDTNLEGILQNALANTLVVWKLDRLGRSMRNLVLLVDELRQRGIHFKSLTDSIDTSSPMGRFIFHIMSALAEMERELIVERTRAGLAAAREKGRIGGRRPKLTPEQWAQAGRLIANGVDRKQVAIIYDVAVCTLYKKFPVNKDVTRTSTH